MLNYLNIAFDKEKTIFVSDIHSNIENLINLFYESNVLDSTYKISLGDVVGYGDNPNETIDCVNKFFDISIQGNHDEAIITEDLGKFSPRARNVLEKQIRLITNENKEIIKEYVSSFRRDNILIFHGSPDSNKEYLNRSLDVIKMFNNYKDIDLFIGGHLHYPTISYMDKKTGEYADIKDSKKLINNEHELDLKSKQYYISVPSLSESRKGFNYPGYLLLKNISRDKKKVNFNFMDD